MPIRMLIGMPIWISYMDAYKDFVREQRVPSRDFLKERRMEMPIWISLVREGCL